MSTSGYPVHRTPEEGHTKACLAKAMICAIENMRDMEGGDIDFRFLAQDNTALTWADYYLAEGLTICLCPELVTVHESYHYGQDRYEQDHRLADLTVASLRRLVGPSVARDYIEELADELQTKGVGSLGWAIFTVKKDD